MKKKGHNMKKILFVLPVMGLVFSSSPVLAKDGFYIGGDLGIAVAPGLDVNSSDNDVGTTCDGFINTRDESGNYLMPPGNCDPAPSAWSNQFDGGAGVLAGASLGYRMGSFRAEAEYFYRGTTYDSTDPNTVIGDEVTTLKAKRELEKVEGAVDDVLSHNFFANLYYDYHSDSKFTPYVGFGVGFARVSLDYLSVWARRVDPKRITTFTDVENFDDEATDAYYEALDDGREPALQPCQTPTCENLNRQVAGTTTIGRGKLSDTLFGYQVVAGVDYQVSEPVSIGLKFRWADFGEFESDPREWDQLRSHESARRPGGARVQYKVMTDDIQFWGVSLNMKYQF